MKRQAFIREREQAGCEFVRHGRRHDLYRNPANGRQTTIPRHREDQETLCQVIRKHLGLGDGGDGQADFEKK